jgi:hypothetical protein
MMFDELPKKLNERRHQEWLESMSVPAAIRLFTAEWREKYEARFAAKHISVDANTLSFRMRSFSVSLMASNTTWSFCVER